MQAERPHPWPAFVAAYPLRAARPQTFLRRTPFSPLISSSSPRTSLLRRPLPSHSFSTHRPRRSSRPVNSSANATSSAGSAEGDGGGHAAPPPDRSPSPSTASKKQKLSVAGVLFLCITYFWSIVLFIPMAIAHPLVLWRDRARRRFHDFIAMAWMRWSLGTVRVTPRIINPDNVPSVGVPAVYVANHTSYLDIYTFAYLYRRIKYVSKAEIFNIPIVGWAMRMAGNIALLRMNRRGQMEAYRKMVDVVKNGLSLVVFPEGTRSMTGKMRRFQAGAFRAAKQSNAPVVPVTILGTRECMPSHAWVPLCYPKEPISLVIHPALDSCNLSVKELQDLSYQAINSALPTDAQTHPPLKHR